MKLESAQQILQDVRGKRLSIDARANLAIDLAAIMLDVANANRTKKEILMQRQLARMMGDPNGKILTTQIADQCFRSQNSMRVADQLIFLLSKYGIPKYLSFFNRLELRLFKYLGKLISSLLVPLVKNRIHQETSAVILPGEPSELLSHLKKRTHEGIRINLNHLGEAILGEKEAEKRLQTYIEDLKNPEIECVSIKASTLFSQINLVAWEETLSMVAERLKCLYRTALNHPYVTTENKKRAKFVNLDMEEYRDLELTVAVFQKAIEDPEFDQLLAGIAIQSYLPDSYDILKKLINWSQKRVSAGKTPIKVRIVKGANLAMEVVDASLHSWPQAPYNSKEDVDANFKRMLHLACESAGHSGLYIGVGSHNLFDIAYAMILRAELELESVVGFEMLEGMADHLRRVVQALSNDMLLYCPVAKDDEFQHAIAYLIRRLDENTASENFLKDSFDLKPHSNAWVDQTDRFLGACNQIDATSTQPRRTQNRFETPFELPFCSSFQNEPDTDWSLDQNRIWGKQIYEKWSTAKNRIVPLVINGKEKMGQKVATGTDPGQPERALFQYSIADSSDLDELLNSAQAAVKEWSFLSIENREQILIRIPQELRLSREDLIGSMMANTAKTIHEADVEVSEAIDFAEYYRRSIKEITSMHDVEWIPKGVVLVAPPWNFPCSIPAGCIIAALAAGNAVIFKPAPEAILVGWQLAQILWKAGVSKKLLQFFVCDDEPTGNLLIQDPRVSTVMLTGGTMTARHFIRLRPDMDLIAETGGKNALIITAMADRDLAIKDLIQSAFGHSGQKCSACSLAICESEVYDDPSFREQLHDAVSSLSVGTQWNPTTKINPLIHKPNSFLERGLTQLDEGEEWLVKPKKINENQWTPGVKLGVQMNSFTYQNELFGPVLGVMRADHLDHAIALANGTQYGLTSGIHSLDEREQNIWINRIEAGNCYINRTITGAIVQRQPFGGCKASSFGFGAKAGGPNYLMQLMHAKQVLIPHHPVETHAISDAIYQLSQKIEDGHFSKHDVEVWEESIKSYAFFWKYYFSIAHDPSEVIGEHNLLKYVPRKRMALRIYSENEELDVLRIIAAAKICGAELFVSAEKDVFEKYQAYECEISYESEEAFIQRIKNGEIDRVRLVCAPSDRLLQVRAETAFNLHIAPVIGNGRIELLHYLREVSLSIAYHRYGYLGGQD